MNGALSLDSITNRALEVGGGRVALGMTLSFFATVLYREVQNIPVDEQLVFEVPIAALFLMAVLTLIVALFSSIKRSAANTPSKSG